MHKEAKYAKEDGQALVEYGMVLILVAIIVVAILTVFGGVVTVTYAKVVGGFNGQAINSNGSEFVVLSLEGEVTPAGASPNCQVNDVALQVVGLQDGELVSDGTFSITYYVNGNARTESVTATAGGVSTHSLSGTHNCPLTITTDQGFSQTLND